MSIDFYGFLERDSDVDEDGPMFLVAGTIDVVTAVSSKH
jgi:hypothetical protein